MPRHADDTVEVIYKGFCWVFGSFFCRRIAEANWKFLKSHGHFIADVLSTWISKADPFLANVPISYPLKTPENQKWDNRNTIPIKIYENMLLNFTFLFPVGCMMSSQKSRIFTLRLSENQTIFFTQTVNNKFQQFFQFVRGKIKTFTLYLLHSLREKCLNTEFFLVRIFPHSNWTRTRKNSVFGHFSRRDCVPYFSMMCTILFLFEKLF